MVVYVSVKQCKRKKFRGFQFNNELLNVQVL